jgi:hypothetical protein
MCCEKCAKKVYDRILDLPGTTHDCSIWNNIGFLAGTQLRDVLGKLQDGPTLNQDSELAGSCGNTLEPLIHQLQALPTGVLFVG